MTSLAPSSGETQHRRKPRSDILSARLCLQRSATALAEAIAAIDAGATLRSIFRTGRRHHLPYGLACDQGPTRAHPPPLQPAAAITECRSLSFGCIYCLDQLCEAEVFLGIGIGLRT